VTFRRTLTSAQRKGFTLVELLIVIILIGILASAILLVAGGAEDKAMANRILSDVRTMKAAAMLYNSDYNSWPIWAWSESADSYVNMDMAHLDVTPANYVGQLPVNDRYWLGVMNNASLITSGDVIAAVVVFDRGLSAGVRMRMDLMAQEMGIYAVANPIAMNFSTAYRYTRSDNNMIWFLTAGAP